MPIFNNENNIRKRKFLAILTTTIVFYIVNILRMVIQLSLYDGANWDDLHYPISSASSFIAVACVLLVHKYVPEFIISLMWIGDEMKAGFNRRKEIDSLIEKHKEEKDGEIIEKDEITPDNTEEIELTENSPDTST